jgi:predicted metalloprotease with PDZ domain
MSTKRLRGLGRSWASALSVAFLAAFAFSVANAQQMSATIRVLPDSSRVIIEGTSAPASVWSFRDSYAGVLGLGNRIERFVLRDETGKEIPSRRIAPGQFESARPASRFQYEINLVPPIRATDSAKVSWLNPQRGLLILADVLPIFASGRTVSVKIGVPTSWAVYSNEAESSGTLSVVDVDRAVFVVGTRLRVSRLNESGMAFDLVADGEWPFADADVVEMAKQVLKSHKEVFGGMPAKKGALILFPFSQPTGGREWSAETRGSTVTLLMGKTTSKVAALAQLSTPLTHECFHLWVPNALALDGDYDWFYEGFTVYQAARAAVRLGLLTFSEFLNAIAGAYDASKVTGDPLSLIEASSRRFTVGASSVYAKSEVIAFIYDLRLRSSGGRRSLNNVYRKLFAENAMGTANVKNKVNGNEAATSALSAEAGSDEFVRKFIRNPVSINLASELEPIGLKVETVGLRTRISVSDKLSKRQRDLLRDLGYNDQTHASRPK